MYIHIYVEGRDGGYRAGERISTQESKSTNLLMESVIVWSRKTMLSSKTKLCILHLCKSEIKYQM